MSDLTPLLREAADALWLIPNNAGLAQRLTNAAERTRPSEAEVTDAMVAAGVAAMEGHAPRLVSRAPEYDEPLAVALRHSFVRNILTAALSTPPLPSAPERDCTCIGSCKGAQGLAAGWRCALSKGAPPLPSAEPVAQEAAWFRWLRDNPQAAAALVALVAQTRPFGPDLGAMMESGEVIGVTEDAKNPEYRYTAPPAAAQDTGRLDWLEENGGRISGPADDSPRFVIWGDTDAQDVQGETLREAIDNAMDAARAAGGE